MYNNVLYEKIASREFGGLPLSIATSFAIESACGILQDRDEEGNPIPTPPKPAPLKTVNELWINCRTLFRNINGAVDKEIKDLLLPDHYAMVISEEMQIIHATIDKITQGSVEIFYYVCDYVSLPKEFSHALIKTPNTEKQIAHWVLEQNTMKLVKKNVPTINVFDVEIKGNHPKAFIISHCPVDLLSKPNFDSLQLLESHTGRIKPHTQWNTKLTNGKELTNIPFNKMTLQIFGDGGVFFSPMPIKIRKVVLEMADKNKWSAVTTKEKIVYGIKQLKDPVARDFLIGLTLHA